MDAIIEAKNLGLRFSAPTDKKGSLKKWVLDAVRGRVRNRHFLALDDVSFRIERGESVGLVGRNGAGKSTLLKLVTGIVKPTAGSIAVRGQVAPLLALGNGLDPALTGRENIYLNGAILGYEKAWLRTKEADIVEFSELGGFIDAPVRTYSSGMTLRLAFSIATAASPEILILDEVLAVGDAAFQAKCRARIEEIVADGATVFFVSHNLSDIEKLCTRAIWLDKGHVIWDGPVADVCPVFGQFAALPFLPIAEFLPDGVSDGTVPVVRFRNRRDGRHLLTSAREEMKNIVLKLSDWACEGTVFRAFPDARPGTEPLMRFLSFAAGVHAFAAGEAEAAPFRNRPGVWKFEKTVGHVFASPEPGLIPVHRLAVPGVPGFRIAVGDAERDAIQAADPSFVPAGEPFYVQT
ncbi:MAG: ABC transporter ATP-binding protein [Kiritimatiellae bacterium]|nr:ABC transporter ATP-binding protein [Kiritimatiellia bacterium]